MAKKLVRRNNDGTVTITPVPAPERIAKPAPKPVLAVQHPVPPPLATSKARIVCDSEEAVRASLLALRSNPPDPTISSRSSVSSRMHRVRGW